MSLFETSGLPRPSNKHVLADYLWSCSNHSEVNLPDDVYFVIDGGDLIHSLSWSRGVTYNQVVKSYIDFVIHKYGRQASIVFDGYLNGPATKDATHLQRNNWSNVIDFDGDMLVCDTKERFLSNDVNKQHFIDALSSAFLENSIVTHHADGDADCLIVSTALSKANDKSVAIVGQDTDLLVLLMYHVRPQMSNVYFASRSRVWDIKTLQTALSPQICNNILFCHAFGGCDTTSSLFNIGKKALLIKLRDSSSFKQHATVFGDESSPKENIITAGAKASVILYGGKENDNLNTLRYVKYLNYLTNSTAGVDPRRLPPTESSAKFHSLQTFFQVQVWMTLCNEKCMSIHSTDWGWELKEGHLLPVCTDSAATPVELLHVVKCNCKTDCTSARCSCRKHGLSCTAGCGHCRGDSCMNSLQQSSSDAEDVELS